MQKKWYHHVMKKLSHFKIETKNAKKVIPKCDEKVITFQNWS